MVLGEKVNKMCARKVGDPAEVHTHFLLHSNNPPPPNKHNLCALTAPVDCRGIMRIHRSPSRLRTSVRLTAILINIHEHLI